MIRLTLHHSCAASSFVVLGLVSCLGPTPPGGTSTAPTQTVETAASPTPASSYAAASSHAASAATAAAAPARRPPDTAAIYARLQPDLLRCYEQGRKATPEMTDGKLTLNASIDAAGKTTCVIPSDHTGLTQEVEDCMSARFAAERFDEGVPWSAIVPIVIRAGVLQRGPAAPDTAVLESVETLRMPDAFDVLEALEPQLQACVRGADRSAGPHGLLVGARVGADGRPQCALATSNGPLPASIGDCAASVLRNARFPPPKRGSGLVFVPINVVGAR